MANLVWFLFWVVLAGLLLAVGVLLRLRLRKRIARGAAPQVDDDAVRSILETGTLDDGAPEPLDLDEIEEEERRFWSESWDEPEEW